MMDQVDTLHAGRHWSEVLCCTVANFVLKFLVKVLTSLYLLQMSMDQVDTSRVSRYWSEVLCCTIKTHLDDLEVKVTDLEFCVKVFG